jgi:hypothetical protein
MESVISIFSLGLILLLIAWLLQLVRVSEGKKEISRNFLAVYGFGIVAIVLDGLMSGLILAPILNLLVLLVILAVMLKIMGKVKAKKRK